MANYGHRNLWGLEMESHNEEGCVTYAKSKTHIIGIADKRFCFRVTNSTIPPLRLLKSEISSLLV